MDWQAEGLGTCTNSGPRWPQSTVPCGQPVSLINSCGAGQHTEPQAHLPSRPWGQPHLVKESEGARHTDPVPERTGSPQGGCCPCAPPALSSFLPPSFLRIPNKHLVLAPRSCRVQLLFQAFTWRCEPNSFSPSSPPTDMKENPTHVMLSSLPKLSLRASRIQAAATHQAKSQTSGPQ